jgi:hypothetical protein
VRFFAESVLFLFKHEVYFCFQDLTSVGVSKTVIGVFARVFEEVIFDETLAIDELAGMFAGEVLPRPLDDGFKLGAHDREQGEMDA